MNDDDRYRRFNLRIPKDTFARLQRAADARSHSMNAEIVQRLEESFPLVMPGDVAGDEYRESSMADLLRVFRRMDSNSVNALIALVKAANQGQN